VAKTRGVLRDFVLELASLDPVALEPLEADDLRAALSGFVRAARGIAHDHYLEQIEPWDDGPSPADSEGGEHD
jgi:hypothetical protein